RLFQKRFGQNTGLMLGEHTLARHLIILTQTNPVESTNASLLGLRRRARLPQMCGSASPSRRTRAPGVRPISGVVIPDGGCRLVEPSGKCFDHGGEVWPVPASIN